MIGASRVRSALVARVAAAATCALLVASCGTLADGGHWGEGVTLLPSGDRVLRAARTAALDPWTWGPLAGAGLLTFSDWDQDLSEWARRETPVFGSEKNAKDTGGTLLSVTHDAFLLSAVATPSGDEALPWTRYKLQGLAVEWGATVVTSRLTSELKSVTGRARPNTPSGGSGRSFPSTVATDAFTFTALSRRNLDSIGLPPVADIALRTGLGITAAGAAWARVEAGAHYPTDVLVGAALGNFIACFLHDAFLGLPDSVRLTAFVEPGAGEYAVGLTFSF